MKSKEISAEELSGQKKRRILVNALVSALQIIVTSITLFLLYRYLLEAIGVDRLGIWSVVLAISSVANVTNFGLSASTVKFVAKYLAKRDYENVAKVIETSTLSIAFISGVVLLVFYPLVFFSLGKIIPETGLQESRLILPHAVLSLWLLIVSSSLLSGIDGFQRHAQRGILVMATAILHLLSSYALVPSYGLLGLAYARIIQNSVTLIGAWIIIKRLMNTTGFLPYRWSRSTLKEMIGYGVNFQLSSIFQMLIDPITKSLITRFGTLELTGYYEMSYRLIFQLRSLIVAANQVLVPSIATLKEMSSPLIRNMYTDSYRVILYLALPYYTAIAAFSPLVSEVWLGSFNENFVFFSVCLSAGWFVNTIAGPAYFANLGSGDLTWNTIGVAIIGLLNLLLGLIFGLLRGGIMIVIASVAALVVGNLFILLNFNRRNRIPFPELLPPEYIKLTVAGVFGVALVLLPYFLSDLEGYRANGMISLFFVPVISWPLWNHPVRKKLSNILKREFTKSR